MEDQKPAKTLRRDNAEYQEIKTHKAAYKDGMKRHQLEVNQVMGYMVP